tara:strand:- start:180 stop:767 length:588 start_codon:yes stop_codon:yes gene_type:complete
MFSTPGSYFTIRRDVYLKSGGFHRNIDIQQIYGIMPFGITGYDETAVFHWRRHEDQLNLQLNREGNTVELKWAFAALTDCNIEQRWQVFGDKLAKKVVSKYKYWLIDHGSKRFVDILFSFRFIQLFNVVKICWKYPLFWFLIPKKLFTVPYYRLKFFVIRNIKTGLKYIFHRFSFITKNKWSNSLHTRIETSKTK